MSVLVLGASEAQRQAAARAVRENIARVQRATDRDIAAVLRELAISRQRIASMLTGTEFDQAFARRMLAEVDAEVERLKAQLGPRFRSIFQRTMESGDADMRALAERAAGRPLLTGPGLDPVLIDFAQQNSADLVQQIGEDLRAKLNRALRFGATGSSTTTEVGQQIGDVVREAGRDPGVFGRLATQTERILRTETQRLYIGSEEATAQRLERDVGMPMMKRWVHNSRTGGRPDHILLDGVAVPLKEHFNVGAGPRWSKVSYEEAQRRGGTLGFRASAPQDAALPAQHAVNCRCGFSAFFQEDDE